MKQRNYAFIDGQNLYQWLNWNLDYKRFRIYLKDKYKVEKAYYFLWFIQKESDMYEKLQDSGFILVFNNKWEKLKSSKKWNIDTNLVFQAMKKLIEDDFDNIILVSWDWDYKMMVDYFIEKNKFLKILFPNKKYASSLYNELTNKYYYHIDNSRQKLEYKKRGS